MMQNYHKQSAPFVVPTSDGKLIEEHFGRTSTGEESVSIAHMVAPPGWSEPIQIPEFDEYTFVIRGRKKVLVEGKEIVLAAGESLRVNRNVPVQYANPFEEEVEYLSVCLPAFSPRLAHRREG